MTGLFRYPVVMAALPADPKKPGAVPGAGDNQSGKTAGLRIRDRLHAGKRPDLPGITGNWTMTEQSGKRSVTVLVVEDEAIVAEDLRQDLIRNGYEVPFIVDSSADALASIEKKRPDIVLMDIYIKGEIDGIRAASMIRDRFHIPVIFLTAYSDSSIIEKAKSATAYGYLLKPYDISQIHASIEMALGKHQLEQQVIESEQIRSALLDATTDALFFVDRNGRIRAANTAAALLIGKPASEIDGMDLEEPARAGRIPVTREDIESVSRTGSPLRSERELDGRYYEISIQPAGTGDTLQAGFAIYCQDITSRKEAFDARIRVANLESLGTLAGGIAHQFNNILTKVLGQISLVETTDGIGKEASDRLARASDEVYRARRLTSRLLTFSRGGTPAMEPLSVVSLVQESLDRVLPPDDSVTASLAVENDLPRVLGDPSQVGEALVQVFENAIQAMPGGGRIRVAVKPVPVREPTGEERTFLEFAITDEGYGIATGIRERVFDLYFTTKPGHSGLGLPIALSIARRHGGDIRIRQAPGGTTVALLLPVAAPESARAASRPEGIRVLIMDDEDMIREIAEVFLSQRGYLVVTAGSGGDALARVRAAKAEGKPFEVAILDLIIPGGMGGKETMEILRREEPDIRAIASSGYSDDPVMADPRRFKFDVALPKPYRLEELDSCIRRVTSEPRTE